MNGLVQGWLVNGLSLYGEIVPVWKLCCMRYNDQTSIRKKIVYIIESMRLWPECCGAWSHSFPALVTRFITHVTKYHWKLHIARFETLDFYQ